MLSCTARDQTARDGPWRPTPHLMRACRSRGAAYNAGGWGVLLYPPQSGDLHQPPASSVRWELLAKGLAEAEYFSKLDLLLLSRRCAPDGLLRSACCRAATASHAALQDTSKVVWNFSSVPSNVDQLVEGPGKHYSYDHPYSTNTTLMHQVVDRVAEQIEAMLLACGGVGERTYIQRVV